MRDDALERALEFADIRFETLGDKERHVAGYLGVGLLRLAVEYRDPGFQVGRLDVDRQSPAETRADAILEALDLLGESIAGNDHLRVSLVERVESMKKLFLRAALVGEKLDIVDQQRIEAAIRILEVVHAAVLQGFDHVRDEALAIDIEDIGVRIVFANLVADRMHEVGFPETHPAVDIQGVVLGARVTADLYRGRPRQLVRFAFDEIPEFLRFVEPRGAVSARRRRGHRGIRLGGPGMRADRQAHGNRLAVVEAFDEFANAFEKMLANPVHDEAVRRQQLERIEFLLDLQGQNPGV